MAKDQKIKLPHEEKLVYKASITMGSTRVAWRTFHVEAECFDHAVQKAKRRLRERQKADSNYKGCMLEGVVYVSEVL